MATTSNRRTGGKTVGIDSKLAERVKAIEIQFESLIERIGDRIEVAMTRALEKYTHVDEYAGLQKRVEVIEAWRNDQAEKTAAQTAAHDVETKHADRRQASVDEWLRTLFPYAVMAFGLLMAFKGGPGG